MTGPVQTDLRVGAANDDLTGDRLRRALALSAANMAAFKNRFFQGFVNNLTDLDDGRVLHEAESFKAFDNKGTTRALTLTLPTAKAGLIFFFWQTGTYNATTDLWTPPFNLAPSASDTIRFQGDAVVTDTGFWDFNSADGNTEVFGAILLAINATEWFVLAWS